MKRVLLLVISVYSKLISPVLHQLFGIKNVCRYEMTCSDYAFHVIKKEGILRGILLSGRRVINCQPYFKL